MPGPKSDKQWSDALRRAVHRESAGKGSPKWLHVIADKVVELAAEGDISAVREIGERLDGKSVAYTESHVEMEISEKVKRDAESVKGRIVSFATRSDTVGNPEQPN